jgi:FkbM family methyltransferase
MLMPREIFEGFDFSGEVLHVGAHHAEELEFYEWFGASKVWWVEANESLLPIITERVASGSISGAVIGALVSDRPGESVEFHIAKKDMSSSMFKVRDNLKGRVACKFINSIVLNTMTINELHRQYNFHAVRFLNVDVEGAELQALRGATDILPYIQYVYVEVRDGARYSDCSTLAEITEFLGGHGFNLQHAEILAAGWGDALFTGGT